MTVLQAPLRWSTLLDRVLPKSSLSASTFTFFTLWICLRTLLWTVCASLQPNPPLDTVEWLCWGREWQLGYHKHPPLGAWLGELGYRLTPGSWFGAYLVGYLCVALALISVLQVARQVLSPRRALAAVFCLDGLVFLGPSSAEYSNYMPHIGFWALTIWLFYRACRSDRVLDWMGMGVAGGLALLCKYSTALLLFSLMLYWIFYIRVNKWGPVVATLVMVLVCLPHLIWLIENDFPTRRWVMLRGQGESGTFNHHLAGLSFLVSQLARLLPVGLILTPLVCLQQVTRRQSSPSPALRFLSFAVLGPVLLHMAASLIGGLQLRDGWGTPLWSFIGVWLLLLLPTDDSDRRRRAFLVVWSVVALVIPTIFLGSVFFNQRPLRFHFPGQALANEVTTRYQARKSRTPAIIAGDWWLAGNICLHSATRPTLYGSLEPSSDRLVRGEIRHPERFYVPDPITSPWTGDQDFAQRGGVLVWDATAFGDAMPIALQNRYPQAETQKVIRLRYQGGYDAEVRVGWAIVCGKEE